MPVYADELITSRKNPLIVRMSKLSEKKHRDDEGLFRIDGVKLFSEAVKSGISIEYTFIADSKRGRLTEELADELSKVGGTVIFVSDEVLSKLTDEAAPQGIVAAARKFTTCTCDVPRDGDFRALYLSQLRDPGNLGTVVRTAYAFGVDRVFVSSDCADIYSPKTIRASMGTMFRQPLAVVRDVADFIRIMNTSSCSLYAAALNRNAKKLGSFDVPHRVCFAIGNEGHGLSDEFVDMCDNTVFIPMAEDCESLNAASAANVLIWEMCRPALTGERK